MTAPARVRRNAVLGAAGAIAAALALVLGGALWTRHDGGARPLLDETVVADLRAPGAAYSDQLRSSLRAARADPQNLATATAAARSLIDEGRRSGDARLVGAALAVLRPVMEPPNPEALYLAATARQHQHDFKGALDLLDRALALAPADAAVLSQRAAIRVVTGRLDLAADDCRRLLETGRVDLGVICHSVAAAPTAAAPAAFEQLKTVLEQTDLFDGGLQAYARGVMGEIAVLQGWSGVARGELGAALQADPDDLRSRIMLADLLIEGGDDAAALELLEGAPDVDSVLLRRAIAAERIGSAAVEAAAVAELARRFRRNRDLGLDAHAREEARFFLQVERDADRALERASVNWALQHEIEDAQLLIAAAAAAGAPEAAAPVYEWMAEQDISVPALRSAGPIATADR